MKNGHENPAPLKEKQQQCFVMRYLDSVFLIDHRSWPCLLGVSRGAVPTPLPQPLGRRLLRHAVHGRFRQPGNALINPLYHLLNMHSRRCKISSIIDNLLNMICNSVYTYV